MTLSPTPARYELLFCADSPAEFAYAVIDHQLEAWASLYTDRNTWRPLAEVLSTHDYGYTFRKDFDCGLEPYTLALYLEQLRLATHITSLGYFSSREQLKADYPEYFI